MNLRIIVVSAGISSLAVFAFVNHPAAHAPSIKIKELQDKIAKLNMGMQEALKDKKNLLDQLALVQSKLRYHQQLINEIKKESQHIEWEIKTLTEVHKEKLQILHRVNAQYAALLQMKWVNVATRNPLVELLHQKSWASKARQAYLSDQLEESLKEERKKLYQWHEQYNNIYRQLKEKQDQKQNYLNIQLSEQNALSQQELEAKKLLALINDQSKQMQQEIERYDSEMKAMELMIRQSISAESNSGKPITTSAKWNVPLNDAIVISTFGKKTEADHKNVVIKNNGVDLLSSDPFVSNAAPSQIIQIREMPNGTYFVMTRNDGWYFVYSNLESVLVKHGEWLEAGNKIGRASKKNAHQYMLHFEIWQGKTPQNPLSLLK